MSEQTTEIDQIDRALASHFVMWHHLSTGESSTLPTPPGEWRCSCGSRFGFSSTAIRHVAKEIRRSLSQTGREDHVMTPGSAQAEWTVGVVAETVTGELVLKMTAEQADALRDTLVFLTGGDDV